VSLRRGIDGSEPIRPVPIEHVEDHHHERPGLVMHLAGASLACPACDAPVALAGRRVTPRDLLACPFCAHAAAARDFLSFAVPTRPARVQVWARVRRPRPAAARTR
jgi:hypothetical protein